MSKANRAFKAVAVATSVLLVAGYVSYRAGAWDGAAAEQPPAIKSEPPDPKDQATQANDAGKPPQKAGPSEQDLMLLSGSKSAILIVPPPKGSDRPGSTAIMGGSKSLAPVVPPAPPPRQ